MRQLMQANTAQCKSYNHLLRDMAAVPTHGAHIRNTGAIRNGQSYWSFHNNKNSQESSVSVFTYYYGSFSMLKALRSIFLYIELLFAEEWNWYSNLHCHSDSRVPGMIERNRHAMTGCPWSPSVNLGCCDVHSESRLHGQNVTLRKWFHRKLWKIENKSQ